MIKITLGNIFKKFSLTITTIISLTITLFVIAFMCASYLNLNRLAKEIDSGFKVIVNVDSKFDKNKNPKIFEQIEGQILNIKHVENFKYSSKDQELALITDSEMGKELSKNLEGDNPLSDTYYVKVSSEKYLKEVASNIKKIKHIESASYGGDVIKDIIVKLHQSESVMFIILGTLIIIAILLMSNILRVAILNQKEAIEIMRLVGASNSYIRMPYILEGIIVTLTSLIISTTALYFSLKMIYAGFASLAIGDIKLLDLMQVLTYSTLVSLGIGLLISLFASTITIRRFIKI